MANEMVKLKVPLPRNDDASGAEAEWMWADVAGKNRFLLRNVPVFAHGMSYGDEVNTTTVDGVPVFTDVAQHNGHSTYRIYAKKERHAPEVVALLDRLKALKCDLEMANSKIIAVDVLPEADVYAVYAALDQAEEQGIIDFEEGHCGHPLREYNNFQHRIPICGSGSQYLGKRLLVGITYEDHDGELIRREQFHGLIVEAGEGEIVIERADTGERQSLPPELMPARPGEYRLRSIGEIVVDPDYFCKWVMKLPKPDDGDDAVV